MDRRTVPLFALVRRTAATRQREGELLSSSVRNRSRAVTSFGRPVPSLAAQQLRKTQFKISVAQISLHKWHSKAVPLTGEGSSLSARIRST